MFKTWTVMILAGASGLAIAGCGHCKRCDDDPWTATGIQEERMDRALHRPREYESDMVDNAILHDMSVADFHFVPHTAELSGTGAARLNRMATLLDTYGGTVRYETFETDEKLVNQRLEHVREYLATTGCGMERVQIKSMLSGGRGMAADKAIVVELKGTKAGEEATRPAASGFGGPAGSSGSR
jgi:hypothetical protein